MGMEWPEGKRMIRRKWIIRGLGFTVAAGLLCALFAYKVWTNPAAIRRQALQELQKIFPRGRISLESASIRLLGGIELTELRIFRHDEPDGKPVFHAPFAIVYHNKEKLLDGTFDIRKVELHRPHLRVIRRQDGKLNLQDIAARPNPDKPLPTIVVRDGTVDFHDRSASSLPAAELAKVNLTLLNDPVSTIAADGAAFCELAGHLQLRGTYHRRSGDANVKLRAKAVSITPKLLQQFASPCPDQRLSDLHLEGTAQVDADIAYQPELSVPLSYNVFCELRDGQLQHPELPLPLEQLSAGLRLHNGRLELERCKGRSGESIVTAHAAANLPCITCEFEGAVEVKHLQLGSKLFSRLPKRLKNLYALFEPAGPATLRAEGVYRNGQWTSLASGQNSYVSLQPQGIDIAFKHFDYPVKRVNGRIDMDLLSKLVRVDVMGHANKSPVHLTGSWQEFPHKPPDAKFALRAKNVEIDETLLDALPASSQKLARSFRATGKGDINAKFRFDSVSDKFLNEIHVHFHDASVHWTEVPYRLLNVSGNLDIYPDRWVFRDFFGTHLDGSVNVAGRYNPSNGHRKAGQLLLDVTGRNIDLNEDLRTALQRVPGVAKLWEQFDPAGRVNFIASLDRPMKKSEVGGLEDMSIDVTVNARGCSIEPAFFPYRLADLFGEFRLQDRHLTISNVEAQHNGSRVTLRKGTIDLQPGGAFYAVLSDLHANPLHPDRDLLNALPSQLRDGCQALALKDPVALNTRLVVAQKGEPGAQPDIYWDGQMWLRHTKLKTGLTWNDVTGTLACIGRYDGHQLLGVTGNLLVDEARLLSQPFRDIHANFHIKKQTPDVLNLDLRAPIFDGDVAGQVRLEFGSRLRYEMNLTASQVDLQKFGRHNLGANTELHGVVVGRLHLAGQGTSMDTLEGNGSIDVPSGRLYNLPLLLDLLKFLGLRWPDRTAFEEAHARFNIQGQRVSVKRLDLLGNAISLAGQGDFNLDGTDLQLDFYPSWGRVEQILPPAVRSLPVQISKNLIQIEMRGKVSADPKDLKFRKRPIPVLLDPLIQMRDRLAGNENPKEPRRSPVGSVFPVSLGLGKE